MQKYKQDLVNVSSPNIPNYKNGPENQHQSDIQNANLHTSPFRRALTSSTTTPQCSYLPNSENHKNSTSTMYKHDMGGI